MRKFPNDSSVVVLFHTRKKYICSATQWSEGTTTLSLVSQSGTFWLMIISPSCLPGASFSMRNRHRGSQLGLLLLASQLFQVGLDNIPPVTLAVLGLNVYLYLFPAAPLLQVMHVFITKLTLKIFLSPHMMQNEVNQGFPIIICVSSLSLTSSEMTKGQSLLLLLAPLFRINVLKHWVL